MNRREITKREIMASVAIIAVMLIIGSIFYSEIVQSAADANEKYNTAIKIEKSDIFAYGMTTNVGNAFVYGGAESCKTSQLQRRQWKVYSNYKNRRAL